MTIRNIKEAEAALQPYVPLAAQLTGKDITLDRMWPLMKLLGNPQEQLKIVHVAGTSGKTSTAYYISALLSATGKKTGLTVSPHIDSITERIQINGRPLSETEFCEELAEFLEIIQTAGLQPSYFELVYAFSLWVFARRKADYTVVETGLGGLHDATNVTRRPDKVCVITDIGLDHTQVLGTTLEAITIQKIGIVHDHNHAFMYEQALEVMKTADLWVQDHQAQLHTTTEPAESKAYKADLSGMPDYQRRNWLLAYYVYRYLKERDELPELTAQLLQATQRTRIPARMDIVQLKGKTIIMDGAHNPQKITAFLKSFQQLYPDTKPAILLALKEGKEYEELVPLFATVAGRIITTTFDASQDLPVHSMDPGVLAQAFADTGVPATRVPDQTAAFKQLLTGPEDVCIITGSFYLLSQLRANQSLA